MRGKLPGIFLRQSTGGLIPACAGKTPRSLERPRKARAHPRVCGENFASSRCLFSRSGSSPRVRGKQARTVLPAPICGLIPACAGKTRTRTPWISPAQAHPRVCGENRNSKGSNSPACGSSPRVRGKHAPSCQEDARPGLIPACAGKTDDVHGALDETRAHPRVCGENFEDRQPTSYMPGSSPRVRGKLKSVEVWHVAAGLIPACAGKTTPRHATPQPVSAHPRVCGENWCLKHAGELVPGSSPRVRGKRC